VIPTFIVCQEEEALIAAHRKEIENTMEIVREVSSVYSSHMNLHHAFIYV
jgi:hypothetical protein